MSSSDQALQLQPEDPGLTALTEDLSDPRKRSNMLEILAMRDLLHGSVIGKTFVVSDTLVRPLKFTPLGKEVISEISSKRKRLKPNEIRLAVTLQFGCSEGPFIDASSDANALRRALSAEVLSKKILFADNFGRELHDAIAEQHPEQRVVGAQESVKLLRALPIGVCQEGRTLVGPFGCLLAPEPRDLHATTDVVGYRCSDETCLGIHRVHLSSADDAAINKTIRFVAPHVAEQHSNGENRLSKILSDAYADETRSLISPRQMLFHSSAGLIEVLADGLALDELRLLCDRLIRIRFSGGRRADYSRQVGEKITNPSDFVSERNRSELLQLILLGTDLEIVQTLDQLVRDSKIQIGDSEVRSRRVQRWRGRGRDIRAEIGVRGVRMYSQPNNGLAAAQMHDLLNSAYFDSEVLSRDELIWNLGLDRNLTDHDLIESAVRSTTPEELLRKLIVSRWQASQFAASYLGIPEPKELQPDELLVTLLWKLGIPVSARFDDLIRVARWEDEVARAARMESPSESDIRGLLSNLFAAIEDALFRSLTFSTWALASDHLLEPSGFAYDPKLDKSNLSFIDEYAPTQNEKLGLSADGKSTLVPLATGFSRLANALEAFRDESPARPVSQIPSVCRHTPRPFAFPNAFMFANLTESSQAEILELLRFINRTMQDAHVLEARNASQHGNNRFPAIETILGAIQLIAAWRLRLEASGIYPSVFALVTQVRDSSGNREYRYQNGRYEAHFYSPAWAYAPRLPTGTSALVIMNCATLPSSGSLRFAIDKRSLDDPYWAGWPVQWKRRPEYITLDESLGEPTALQVEEAS